jgi:dTDP-6-deoxy-L-talose 4-dehydrogenase (NAD+)
MKILVTGSSGFIGKRVVERLTKDTQNSVIRTHRNEEWKQNLKNGSAQHVYFNLRDISSADFTSCGSPDMVIHCGWDDYRNVHSLDHIGVNFFNSYHWLKRLVEEGLSNIVCIGSAFEYGLTNGELGEELDTKPTTSYSLAKDSLRKSLELLSMENNVTFKWLRVFNVFGIDQHPKTLFGLLDSAILEKQRTFKMSGGEQLRDYIDIDVLAEMITTVALQDEINGVINCCSGNPVSIRKLVEQYLNDRGVSMELELGFYPYASYEPMSYWGGVEKVEKIMGRK